MIDASLARVFCLCSMLSLITQYITAPQSEYTTSDCCRQSLRRARRKGSPASLPAAEGGYIDFNVI